MGVDRREIWVFLSALPAFEPVTPPCHIVVLAAHLQEGVETESSFIPTPPAFEVHRAERLEPVGDRVIGHAGTVAMFPVRSQ